MARLHPVCLVSELPPGARKIVRLGKFELGVFNVEGAFYAYRNICPHAGAPVCVGTITGTTLASAVYEYPYGQEGRILRCPWHAWEFDLRTGEHLVDPDTRLKKVPVEIGTGCEGAPGHDRENLESFPVERQGDTLYVSLPDSAARS